MAPKTDGWNSFSIDHDDKDRLVEKYRDSPDTHRHNHAMIEDVDFVWRTRKMIDAVPTSFHNSFDAVIASHVIEHTPDLIEFLTSIEKLLATNGVVILAVPDKRFCYDFFRPLTSTSDLISAHKSQLVRHQWASFFNHDAYTYYNDGRPGWSRSDYPQFAFTRPISHALAFANGAPAEEYVDLHAWTFTPSSFELLILELQALEFINLRIEELRESDDLEFFVWLTLGESQSGSKFWEVNAKRLDLLNRIVLDLEVQARQIRGNQQMILEQRLDEATAKLVDLQTSHETLKSEYIKLLIKTSSQ